MSPDGPAIAVVIVTHESAREIARTLAALDPQLRADDELIVVDSASRDDTPAIARAASGRATVLAEDENVGFARGCHVGADATSAPLLLFLNPDARPEAGAVEHLRRIADSHPGWGAWQALVTMSEGREINTSGGVVHFTGLGWAGRCGEPVDAAPAEPVEVGFASGAAFTVRRDAWRSSGGFAAEYFMYGEDLDLSLRLRLAGWGVGVEPRARVEHAYAFTKGDYKWFLLERNRWWTLLGTYPTPLLALLAPALIASELALLVIAAGGGWLGEKLRADASVLRSLRPIRARRAEIQGNGTIGADAFAAALGHALDSPFLGRLGRWRLLRAAMGLYWRAVRAAVAQRAV